MPSDRQRLQYVKVVRKGDKAHLYYSRAGKRWPLPGPEGSTVFLIAYGKIHAAFGSLQAATPQGTPGTVEAAINLYLSSADFQAGLKPTSRRLYRRTLDGFRGAFGSLFLADMDIAFWETLRDRYASTPHTWNPLRSRMRAVIAMYRKRHPELVPTNPLMEAARLPVGESDQNRPWPPAVLRAALGAATPAFRALLVAYLLTAQRGGDVTTWRWAQYDAALRLLTMRQRKTDKALPMPISDALATVIESQRGRHREYIFVSPRGRRWTLGNAQETLARLLQQLGQERYTLHGLRATGPTALKRAGMENRRIRELTGHDSDRNLEVYLRGAGGIEMRTEAVEMLEQIFDPMLTDAAGGNQRRFSGVTGRAARKARV